MAENVEREQIQLDEAISVLEATPAILRSLLARAPATWLDFREGSSHYPLETIRRT
jgi:hypothetical protein